MAVPPPPFPDPAPASDAKAALRSRLRARRRAFVAGLSDAALRDAGDALRARLAAHIPSAGAIAGYAAHRGEPDILPLLHALAAEGRPVALPVAPAGGMMQFLRWTPAEALGAGHAGIPEPQTGAPVAPAVLLMPLLGFTRAGARLGQGGGFYDRWCAAHPRATRIGVAWRVQEQASLPLDPWDMPLDAIATECDWIVP